MMTRVFLLVLVCSLFLIGCDSESERDSVSYPASSVGSTKTLDVPATYATIQEAVNAAETGDFIRVAAGTYTENITIKDKSFSLRGAGMEQTIIQGSVEIYNTSETSFEGFTVQGGGIHAKNSPVRITGNQIINNPGTGLWVENCPQAVLSDNQIKNNGQEGIVFSDSTGVIGSSQVSSNNSDGIVINNSSPTLLNNSVTDNRRDGVSIRGFTSYSAPLLLENFIANHEGSGNYDIICFGEDTNPTGAGNVFDTCINCAECRSFGDAVTYQD